MTVLYSSGAASLRECQRLRARDSSDHKTMWITKTSLVLDDKPAQLRLALFGEVTKGRPDVREHCVTSNLWNLVCEEYAVLATVLVEARIRMPKRIPYRKRFVTVNFVNIANSPIGLTLVIPPAPTADAS